ncbi:MAG: M20/M25/M40 family metallo-hydrolase [Gemmatimonadales bacterium]
MIRAPSLPIFLTLMVLAGPGPVEAQSVDREMVARIREEGLQHSRVMDLESYMTDVLGARLTLSRDMQRAQEWVRAEMARIGLANIVAEPFMDFGVTWDNEYVSVHMLEPDYSPMVAYPIAHTPGTDGRQVGRAVIVDILTRGDMERLRGTLHGMIVLATPPATIDIAAMTRGVPRRTEAELRELEETVIAPARPVAARTVRNPDVVAPDERMAFLRAEGVIAVLQSESGWLGAVRGFSRPGSRGDQWSRAGDLASPTIIAVTPEHYNRMYRILQRDIAVTVEVEVRNRIGEAVERAVNLTAEIPGTDLRGEVVMIGAHFDTWHASPNASDNTSGVAVALEAMRILKAVGAQPRRTIRVALWSGEEQGLFGSRAYVATHFGTLASPKPDHNRLSAYFNQDYGSGQYRGIYLQGNEAARSMFSAWMQPFRDLGMTTISNQGVGSTDHIAFDEVGLPGFQFLQDRTPGQGGHTNLDFFDTIQAEDLMKNAVIMASFAYHAAMADTRVPRKWSR